MMFLFPVKNDTKRLSNLNEVLNVIKANGLCFKLEKGAFVADEVVYLRCKVN